MDHKRVKLLLFSLAIISLIASITLPIWSYGGVYPNPEFTLQYTRYDFYTYGVGFSGVASLFGQPIVQSSFVWITSVPSHIQLPLLIFLIVSIFTVGLLIFVVYAMLKKEKNIFRLRLNQIVWLVLVLNVFAIVSFPIFWTWVLGSDNGNPTSGITFWGSHSSPSVNISFGPNIGYFLQFMALVFILGGIWVTWKHKEVKDIDLHSPY